MRGAARNGRRPGLKPRLNGCLSRMQGNLHVRFLGGDATVRSCPYPTYDEGSIPFTRSNKSLFYKDFFCFSSPCVAKVSKKRIEPDRLGKVIRGQVRVSQRHLQG